ncbi:unnamed protein product [Medioppia subpectinata]|uniref:Acyl carrier protein n=1 Tax=Medioppia subpectinata TaxID=1979941 RepID=A0A7R9L1Q4_9ACAR|nr:unnamed protein product [Medioppia subpectinata]CAG2113904.1 unnamed protein product [Medioppia subpectinata]
MSSRLLIGRLLRPAIASLTTAGRRPLHCPTAIQRFPSYGPPKEPVVPKDIEFRVLNSLAKHDKIDANSLTLSTHLTQDLGLDSLDIVELVVELEDEFALEIPDADAERLLTVQSLVDWVVQYLEAKGHYNQRPGIEFLEGMTRGRPMN